MYAYAELDKITPQCLPKWLKHQQCRRVLSNSRSHHQLPFQTWPFALLCWMYDGISVLLWLLTKLSSYLHTFWYVYVSSSLRCSIMSFAHFGDTIIKEIFFVYFLDCAGSLLLHGLFSSCGAWTSHYSGLFSCWSQTGSRLLGFRCCSFRALEHRLNSCETQAWLLLGTWDLPVWTGLVVVRHVGSSCMDQESNQSPLH